MIETSVERPRALRLVSHHLCPYVQRAVIVLTEKDIPHERTYIDLADKPDWFRAMSPLGRVPVLVADGSVVFESQVIAEYLDEVTPGPLHPPDPLAKARHRSWIEFGSETLNAIGGLYNAKDAAAFDARRADLRAKFARIEQDVVGPYFAGDRSHLVDGVWGTVFRYFDAFDRIADFGVLAGLDKVSAWRRTVAAHASVAQAAPADYPERLMAFLAAHGSRLSAMMSEPAAPVSSRRRR